MKISKKQLREMIREAMMKEWDPRMDDLPPDRPDEHELSEDSIIIQDARKGGLGYDISYAREEIASNVAEWEEAIEVINNWMSKNNYYPNVYHINERGNIDQIDPDSSGDFIHSWV